MTPLNWISALLLGLPGAQEELPSLAPPPDRDWHLNYALYLGQSELESDFWDPVDRPIVFGMEFAVLHETGLGVEFAMNLGYDEEESGVVDIGGTLFETDLSTELFELSGGLRLQRDIGSRWFLYGGGGLAWVDTVSEIFIEQDLTIADDSDDDFGFYYHGGFGIRVTPELYVGLDVRGLEDTQLEIDSFDTSADYLQFALVVGGGK
jgi:hypothetical protein